MPIPLHHIPVLFVASALTFGGMWANWDPHAAALEFGLPQHVADSLPAQSVMILSSGRGSAIGLAILVLYFKKQYVAIDTILISLLYVGFIDGWICWREGVPNRAIFRALSGALIAAMGWFGWTSSGAAVNA